MIIGVMLLFTVQALGELAVLYPVNGAFFTYGCRFLDESWYVWGTQKVYKSSLTFLPGDLPWAGTTHSVGLPFSPSKSRPPA